MAFSSHQIHSISSSSSTDDEMFLDACEMIQSSASTSKEHNSTDQLFADVDAVNVAIHKKFPNLYVNPNLIFEQLEFWGKEKDRVNIVTKLLSGEESASENQQHADNHVPKCERQENESKVFGNHTASSTASEEKEQNVSCLTEQKSEDSHDQLMDDVLKVIGVVPTANPEVVYSLLEVRRDEPNRVELIIEEVLREFPVKSPIHLAPLQNDTHVGVPKREPSYSDLNSYNSVKRQRTVEGSPTKDDVKELSPSATTSSNFKTNLASIDEAVPSTSADSNLTVVEDPSVTEARIKERQLVLQGMFPDADPDYLQELVMSYMDNEEELQQAVARMLEEHNYPKMKDRLEKEKLKELKHKYSTWTFTVDEVLQWFEDPIKLFYNTSRNLSPSYKEHAYRQLCNDFTKLTLNDIKLALTQNNYCYAPALRFLQQKLPMETKKRAYKRRQRPLMPLPEIADEIFYKELAFTKIEGQLRERLECNTKLHKEKFETAKDSGQLITCLCCFDEENLLDDMLDCGASHLFCKECVRCGTEVALGQGKCELSCMSDNCQSTFSLSTLQQALSPNVFSNLLRKIQVEEITKAEIPDLVQCPYCSFAAIMPNQEDKVFRCLNADCLKETCRVCKEPNHVPLRCEEVEKSDEVKMRTYIESKMTEALVRNCYKCKRRFIKSVGCNMMTCVCGAHMCYICRQPIKNYDHFTNGQCPQNVDTTILHQNELIDSAQRAKKDFLQRHPEMKDVHLKYDPTNELPASTSVVLTPSVQPVPPPAPIHHVVMNRHALQGRVEEAKGAPNNGFKRRRAHRIQKIILRSPHTDSKLRLISDGGLSTAQNNPVFALPSTSHSMNQHVSGGGVSNAETDPLFALPSTSHSVNQRVSSVSNAETDPLFTLPSTSHPMNQHVSGYGVSSAETDPLFALPSTSHFMSHPLPVIHANQCVVPNPSCSDTGVYIYSCNLETQWQHLNNHTSEAKVANVSCSLDLKNNSIDITSYDSKGQMNGHENQLVFPTSRFLHSPAHKNTLNEDVWGNGGNTIVNQADSQTILPFPLPAASQYPHNVLYMNQNPSYSQTGVLENQSVPLYATTTRQNVNNYLNTIQQPSTSQVAPNVTDVLEHDSQQ